MQNIDFQKLKEKVREYAYTIGIDKIGFTDSEPLTEHLPRLLYRKNAGYKYGINEGDPDKRINPLLHMAEAKSIISVAVAYPWHDAGPGLGREERGRFSLIARGYDYHDVVSNKLEMLRDYVLLELPQAKIITMVDKEEVLEKAIAVRAGLGWFGKNTLLLTPEYGSWVYLGEVISDVPFPPDRPFTGDCGECRTCIQACPAKALDEDKNLNTDKCLACLTLGKFLPDLETRELIKDSLYGCDICQMVCPYNKKAETRHHPEFSCQNDDAYPLLKNILKMTNAEFKEQFGHISAAWRGRTPIQRNAVIAAGNLRATGVVPELIDILLSDPRPVMRATAAWALGKVGVSEGLKALGKALLKEKNPDVIREIKQIYILKQEET